MGKVIGLIVVSVFFICFHNIIRQIVKTEKNKKLLKEAQFRKQKQYLKSLKDDSGVNNYSVCLSIDYRVKRDFSANNKIVVNKVIFAKMKELLGKISDCLEIKITQDVLVVLSYNFHIYDIVYDNILKILSKIKPEIDERYGVYMIPSITTDAYTAKPDIEEIKYNHMNIKHCNLMGASCITEKFGKKYKFLKKNKYAGTPIGEYAIVDKERENTYELNLVHKSLSNQLEKLGA